MPYINASIILQLLATAFPALKKMQREGGPQVTPCCCALSLKLACRRNAHPRARPPPAYSS